MPPVPDWKRALDTGAQFTEMRRSQARKLASDLVAQGQLARNQVGAYVDELVEASRRRSEQLRAVVRTEVERQLGAIGVATKGDLDALERKLRAANGAKATRGAGTKPGVKSAAKKRAPAKKATKAAKPAKPAAKRARSARRRGDPPSSETADLRRRLDVELVRRGLASSRTRASDAIAAGRVSVSGLPATTAARQVDGAEPIVVAEESDGDTFVSRGGTKLAGALDAFAVDVANRRAVDVGASTGGFTDCLLQRGAAHVVAIDVGRGQLAWTLRNDPRVTVLERTNVRELTEGAVDPPAGICVADLSFISLRTVAPSLLALTSPDAEFVLLVKPQFEAGRARLGKGGIVRDPAVHEAVLREVVAGLDGQGIGVEALVASPLRGADGNVEFFVRAHRGPATLVPAEISRGVRRARCPRVSAPATRTVGLVPHRDRASAHVWARAAAQWFGAEGVVVRIPKEEAVAAGLPELGVAPDEFLDGLDLVVSLGGDGTMLHAVDLVYPAAIPILGVNVGQLGYLTDVEPEELEAAMPRLLTGEFAVLERMVLEVVVTADGPAAGTWFALNEAALEKQRSGHLIRLDVSINGTAFTTYAADGVIVATPTGTTAYSFSVRGPIASPALRCLVLTPVSPHMLFDRSLVLADREELGFVVCGERGNVVLTVDGRELGELAAGDEVTIRAANDPLRLASLRPRDFHQVLKAKFDLPDR